MIGIGTGKVGFINNNNRDELKKICIILPVYNVKQYLERCISSINAQTYHNYEVLLIDDGSTDGSGAICDKISAIQENVICFHKENGGAGDARNFGIEQSRGGGYSYIAFVDPDDILETRYLEELIKTINNADLAICGYRTVSYSGEEIVQEIEFKNALKGVFSDYAEELCVLHKNTLLFGPCNKLFQASIIYENNDIRFGLTKRYEDTTFIYRYLLHCSSISFTPACLYRYSKFLHGRKTAVTSFGNEQCEGAFIAYEEGQKVVQHMIDNRMNPDAIMRFKRRLEKHLETSIFGEAIVSVSCSSLTWKERKHYIKAMIQRFHGFLPAFSKGDVKSVDKAARMMANKGFYDGIVALSYLYQFKHCK